MPLRYLLDEHLRGGGLWQAIQHHNALGVDLLDVLRVGDSPDLPLGMPDPSILQEAERQGRIFVSRDKRTLSGHRTGHLGAGFHSPGIFLLRTGSTIPQVLASLVLAAHAGDPADYADRVTYIPF
jgi:hypothetical protein